LNSEELALAEFVIVTWTIMIQGRLEQHEETIKKNLDYCRKNAKRFKLKSMRYFAQALGGDSFHYGRVLAFEFETLENWENFRTYIEENEKAFALKEQWLANIDVKTLRIVEWQDRQREAWLEQ
jgi:hypothetical protein